MDEEVARDPTNQPELQIDTNESAEYGVLAQVLAAAKNARHDQDRFRPEVSIQAPASGARRG